MSDRDLATGVLVFRVLGDQVAAKNSAVRDEALDHLLPGDRIRAVLPDGTDLGTVSVTKPRLTARVVDERALLAWVAEHAPTEVETITRVRPAYLKRILDTAKAMGTPVDEATGEVIPGIEVTMGEPGISARPSANAAEDIARAWAAGTLRMPELLAPRELEAGEQ